MNEKKRKGRFWRTLGTSLLGAFLVLVALALGVIGFAVVSLDREADHAVMESMRYSRSSTVYAPKVHAHPLTDTQYDPLEIDLVWGDENMVWVDGTQIPEALKHAFVAIEDKRFYEHDGVDWRRTIYATLNYLFRFRNSFGGSSITQQLVKNVHGDKEVTPMRKIKEIIRATRVERVYTKDEILTYYLNIVPMGHSCVGVRAASRYYFGKEPSALSLVECATLAAITNAPSRYEPILHLDANTKRRNLILAAMLDEGYIDEHSYQAAMQTVTEVMQGDAIFSDSRTHNWYVETAIEDVVVDLADALKISPNAARAMVYRGGLSIYTAMDTTVQETLEAYFEKSSHFMSQKGTLQGAMVVMDPYSGDLLGIVGGTGKKEGNRLFNRASAYYPPGSSLKPLALYAPAIESGLIHWGTAFVDAPSEKEGRPWPHNSPNLFMGQITAHEALARSKNTVAVTLYEMLGKEQIFSLLQDLLGFSGLVKEGIHHDMAAAPLALGQLTRGVSPIEMCAAFCSFASGGILYQPRSYVCVKDSQGNTLLNREVSGKRVWSEQTAYILTKMMEEVVAYGTARTLTLDEITPTAGKTGTSGGDKDKWFVGYTPRYVASVHVSFDNGGELPAGSTQHLMAFDGVMRALYSRVQDETLESAFHRPGGIYELPYCLDSGCIPTDACKEDMRGSRIAYGYFSSRGMPSERCEMHIHAYYDFLTDMVVEGDALSPFVYPFVCLDDKKRKVPDGVILQDMPYTFSGIKAELEREKDAESEAE